MPRWFGSSASSASAAAADAAAPPAAPAAAAAPPVLALPPSREELDKLRKRVEEVAPRAFATLLASQEPGLSSATSEGGSFDDDTLTRWLVAEERDVERAAKRLAAHAEWRGTLLPAGWTPDKEAAIAKELAAGKTWFSASPDPRGRPYILSPSNRHQRSTRDLAASRLALVYAMDSAARAADAAKAGGVGDGRVVSVIDARGVGLANLDPEVSKMVVEIAQDHYPERSLTTFVFGAPSAFAAIVQLLLPLVSPSSRGKIKFVKAGSDWASAGVAIDGSVVVDGASLPRVLGGTGPDAVPVQVAARSVGILKDLPVPAVASPAWGVAAAGGGGAEAEEEEGGRQEEASAASASAAAPAAEGKATEQRSGVVSLTATAAP